MRALVAHDVAQDLLEQRVGGHLLHEPERRQGEPLDHDLHVQVGHVPAAIRDDVELVRARARRNTLLAAAYDLKDFFERVDKDPLEVTVADLLGFVRAPRQGPSSTVVRISDGSSGLAFSTVKRRGTCLTHRASPFIGQCAHRLA